MDSSRNFPRPNASIIMSVLQPSDHKTSRHQMGETFLFEWMFPFLGGGEQIHHHHRSVFRNDPFQNTILGIGVVMAKSRNSMCGSGAEGGGVSKLDCTVARES